MALLVVESQAHRAKVWRAAEKCVEGLQEYMMHVKTSQTCAERSAEVCAEHINEHGQPENNAWKRQLKGYRNGEGGNGDAAEARKTQTQGMMFRSGEQNGLQSTHNKMMKCKNMSTKVQVQNRSARVTGMNARVWELQRKSPESVRKILSSSTKMS